MQCLAIFFWSPSVKTFMKEKRAHLMCTVVNHYVNQSYRSTSDNEVRRGRKCTYYHTSNSQGQVCASHAVLTLIGLF